jgi:hypothetical protein
MLPQSLRSLQTFLLKDLRFNSIYRSVMVLVDGIDPVVD